MKFINRVMCILFGHKNNEQLCGLGYLLGMSFGNKVYNVKQCKRCGDAFIREEDHILSGK